VTNGSRASASSWVRDPGLIAGVMLASFLFGVALAVDVRKASFGFFGDESTYYSLGLSLARDGDFAFERRDLVRVWEDFPAGPEGIFLKRGQDIDLEVTGTFPFVRVVRHDDRGDRLYYGKSFLYPLLAAPFVWLLGTNGFLFLNALLFVGNFAVAYVFLRARSSPVAAAVFAFAFFFASAAPVYFVWVTPEVLNLSLVLYGLFAWAYKEVAGEALARGTSGWSRLMRSPVSDVLGAVLLGLATFSKPTNALAIVPMALLYLVRREWVRGALTGLAFALTVAATFGANTLISGEPNYQGGDRKTFYASTGYPFMKPGATYDTTGVPKATDQVSVDVLTSRDAFREVLPHNLVYFVLGRHTGLLPYFFPGILLVVLFLAARRTRQAFQWCVLVGIAIASLALMIYMPFTYSGGGGPVGNRYFMGYYSMFVFLAPPLATVGPAVAATVVGGLFTAQLVLNPFYSSFYPAEHAKRGILRLLPVELSLINDLPLNVTPGRAKQPLGGEPPVFAYFLDDNAYNREGDRFWVKGRSKAEMILRAPARRRQDGSWETLRLKQLKAELETGAAACQVVVEAGAGASRVSLRANAGVVVDVKVGQGVPYQPVGTQPTNYIYRFSVSASNGFVPMFTSDSQDFRYLGVMVRIVPVYE